MQFVLKHRVQCLQWYITLVVSFASYPCNELKTHVGRPKCESDTSIVRHVLCENKDADQLRGNRKADQRLCSRYSDSTIPLLLESEISSLQPSSVAVQPGL